MNHSALLGVIGLGNEHWWRVASLGLLTGEPFLLCLSQFPSYLDAKTVHMLLLFIAANICNNVKRALQILNGAKEQTVKKTTLRVLMTCPVNTLHHQNLSVSKRALQTPHGVTGSLNRCVSKTARRDCEAPQGIKTRYGCRFNSWCESETATPQTGPLCT